MSAGLGIEWEVGSLKRLAILLGIIGFCLMTPVFAEEVCHVHDGDTVTLCNGKKVRLHAIDAPELAQPFGPQSRDYLKAMVVHKDVALNCPYPKSYRRLVCDIRLDGQDVEAKMVEAGMAFDYPKYSHGQYASLERKAQTSKIGVWAQDNGGMRPWDYRHKGER